MVPGGVQHGAGRCSTWCQEVFNMVPGGVQYVVPGGVQYVVPGGVQHVVPGGVQYGAGMFIKQFALLQTQCSINTVLVCLTSID